MMRKTATTIALRMIAATAVVGMCRLTNGQDMEPRAYSPAPVGTNFVAVTYGHSSGDVLPDPTLPIQNASLQFNNANFGYYHAFGLFNRQTSVAIQCRTYGAEGRHLLMAPTLRFTALV